MSVRCYNAGMWTSGTAHSLPRLTPAEGAEDGLSGDRGGLRKTCPTVRVGGGPESRSPKVSWLSRQTLDAGGQCLRGESRDGARIHLEAVVSRACGRPELMLWRLRVVFGVRRCGGPVSSGRWWNWLTVG